MEIQNQIEQFLDSASFGVVGASTNRDKYGNKVVRVYQQSNRDVIPVNPRAEIIEGESCVAAVADLPESVDSISVITPPKITEQVVEQAIAKGIKNIWMQPGAESAAAIDNGLKNGLNIIADGSCILVVLGFHDH
jgi:predicted CoA-binding protein